VTRRGPLATLAIVVVISVGCSNGPAETGSSSGGAGDNVAASSRQKAVTFAECMRDNGVSDFPDPDASGQLSLDGVLNGSSLDPNSPAWTNAIGVCKDLQPPGFTGNTRTAPQQEAALKFAQCIRDNGVSDFPDPTPDGPLIDTTRIPSLAGKDPRSSPGLTGAMQKCRDRSAAAGVTGR
jgi:hypothetical protein